MTELSIVREGVTEAVTGQAAQLQVVCCSTCWLQQNMVTGCNRQQEAEIRRKGCPAGKLTVFQQVQRTHPHQKMRGTDCWQGRQSKKMLGTR